MSEPVAGTQMPASLTPPASDSPQGSPRAPTRPPPAIPDHELLHPIGRGAYGEVWLARSIVGTLRAVKVVYRQDFGDSQPFDREFKGIQKFEPVSRLHDGLIDILQIGRNEAEGYFYYVMELADSVGGDRRSEMGDRGPRERPPSAEPSPSPQPPEGYCPRTLRHDLRTRGRLPIEECLKLGLALTSALEHLHKHGLVHRDVKPSNVVFVNGQPKLADIGLVAGVDEARSFVGTEGFIPPEGPGKPQADLYSLGIVLYVMSTGSRHDAFPEPRSDLASDPDQARWLELNAIIHKACHADLRQRYPSAAEMKADLELLQQGQSVRRKQRMATGWRMARIAGAAGGGVALLAAALLRWETLTARQAENRAKAAGGGLAVFVLPFRNPTNDEDSEEIAARVTDGLIDSLGLVLGRERVGPRKSGWLLKSDDEARRRAFDEFSPGQAISGHLSVTNGRIEVAVSGYAAPQGHPGWTEQVAGSTNDLVTLEWKVVEEVAKRLKVGMPDVTRARVLGLLSNNVAALEWCRRGEEYGKVWSVKRLTQQAKDAVHRAKQLDPNCIRALDGLLMIQRSLVWNRSHRDSWSEVRSLAEDILRIDDTAYAGRYWMAEARLYNEWDWEGGVPEREQVARDWQDYLSMALLDRTLGRFEESRVHQAEADRHSEHGGPLLTRMTANYVHARYAELYEGKRDVASLYDEVIAGGRYCQQQDPELNYGCWVEALGHLGKRDYSAAIRVLQRGRAMYDSQEHAGLEGYAYAKLGEREKALNIIDGMLSQQFPQPYWIARIHAALGDHDRVFEWLEKAVEDRCEWLVKPDYGCGGLWLDEAWDGLRSDPRFVRIQEATGLKWPKQPARSTP